jgi:LPXTG-motif cell wall-anchored protein
MLRKLAAGTSAALVAAGLAATPAVASRLPTADESCSDVGQAGQQGLDKVTNPADGSLVQPGDDIEVTLRWDEDLMDSAVLDRALDCVQVDGRPVPGLGLDQSQVPNEGHVTYRYRIPARLAPGTEICDQGFVFGPLADVPQRLSSNRVCFTVAPPASAPSPGPGGPAGGVPPVGRPIPGRQGAYGSSGPGELPPELPPYGPPGGPGGSSAPPAGGPAPGGPGGGGPGPSGAPPSAETAQPPGPTGVPPTLSPPPVSTGPTPSSSPADLVRPAETKLVPAGSPRESPPPLPRTGGDARPLAAAGGLNLIGAGLALIGGARRRRRRQRNPIPPPPAPSAPHAPDPGPASPR